MSQFAAQQFAVCMAWDAFRIALAVPPKNFTKTEVLRWLALLSPNHPNT